MKNCLVTKLKAVVDNNDLIKTSDATLSAGNSVNSNYLSVKYSTLSNQVLRIIGDGYFTDVATRTENYGKTLTTGNANTETRFSIVSNSGSRLTVVIPNRNDVTRFGANYYGFSISRLNIFENLKSLSCNTGAIGKFADCPSGMTYFMATQNTTIQGDVDDFISTYDGIRMDISNSFGDKLSSSVGSNFNLSLAKDTLYYLCAGGGSATSIKGNVKCSYPSSRTSGGMLVVGTLTNNKNNAPDFGNDLDAYLIDQATKGVPSQLSSWEKAIIVRGTRTSASDQAVTTIKGKGISVNVNGTAL